MPAIKIKDFEVHPQKNVDAIRRNFARHLKYSLAKDGYTATDWDRYMALAMMIRNFLIERWIETQQTYHHHNVKRVYYLSLEYLMGRSLANNIFNLRLDKMCQEALQALGLDWRYLCRLEADAGLGNGGLGRLAACFLDSMTTLRLPCTGYGLRYDYGIFRQEIQDGYQREEPDEWLRFGNPWEIERPEYTFPVYFGGRVERTDYQGHYRYKWIPAHHVLGVPYDTPVVGYGHDNVNTLRLWSAKASEEFDFEDFSEGDYIQAVAHKIQAENLTKVLYPNDQNHSGKELRFRQQYLFVSCSLQDIIRRFKVDNDNHFERFPKKVAIQLNDTHPALAVAELMHIFVDKERLPWEFSWEITVATFGYTNHTLLPEALEKWPVELFEKFLPRHLQIIFEINRRFLERVSMRFPRDSDRLKRMSLVEEEPQRQIRMAYLATVGSHSINGVAALHTKLLTKNLFRDFYEFFPDRFNNKTNGVTQRRWLLKANTPLADWITQKIGDDWITNLEHLRKLEQFANDADCRESFRQIKLKNKRTLCTLIEVIAGIQVNPDAIFDVQIKRLHEYKRQLLNVLHIVMLYTRLKDNPNIDIVPRVFIFAGKAAPGYFMAKLIIKLINCVAEVINKDEDINDKLKVIFFPNYGVSLAELIIPAAEVSEQISTAGMEASGTGNMKLTLNGALTIGTLDGANIEIREEVGDDNIFIFGLNAQEIEEYRRSGNYNSWDYYHSKPEIKRVLDLTFSNFFSLHNPGIFDPIYKSLLDYGDPYFVLADLLSYAECQSKVEQLYRNHDEWNRKAILNVARVGKFSSDRVISQYAKDIWQVSKVNIDLSRKKFNDTLDAAHADLEQHAHSRF